jgi:hypothetical protein
MRYGRGVAPPKVVELPPGVLAIRRGPGANCSSIGSVIDMLFGAVVVSGMLYAGVVVALGDRKVQQVGGARTRKSKDAGSDPG